MGSLALTGLKTGHYRESLSRRRFGWRGGLEVVEVLADGIADGPAPGIGAEGVDVFLLGKMDGLDESLGEIGDSAGGKILAGEEIGQFVGEFIGGAGLGVFAGVVGAEAGMMGAAGSAALATVGESETTQGLAVLIECGCRAAN